MNTNELKIFIYGSIISADNMQIDEDVKQDVMKRYKQSNHTDFASITDTEWAYILAPIEPHDEEYYEKCLSILTYKDNPNGQTE